MTTNEIKIKITKLQANEIQYRLEVNEDQNEINETNGDPDRLPVWGTITTEGKSTYLHISSMTDALDDIDDIINRWTDQMEDGPDECRRSGAQHIRSMKGLRDKLAPPAPVDETEWAITFRTVRGRRTALVSTVAL